jgi:hypothetical protein
MYPRIALQLNTSPRSYGFYKKFSSGPRPGCAPRMRRQCHSVLTPFLARSRGATTDGSPAFQGWDSFWQGKRGGGRSFLSRTETISYPNCRVQIVFKVFHPWKTLRRRHDAARSGMQMAQPPSVRRDDCR